MLQGASSKDPSCATSEGLYAQAREISPRLRFKSNQLLAQELVNRGCINKRISSYTRGWQFPPLPEARAAWSAQFPGHRWRDPTITEWQESPEVREYNERMADGFQGYFKE